MFELQLFHGPNWFTGFDLFMDFFNVIVVSMIAYFAYRFYAVDKNRKKSLFLFQAMVGLALALVFKIIAYMSLYITKSRITELSYLGNGVYQVQVFNSLHATFFFMHAILMIAALYLFFLIYEKNVSKYNTILTSSIIVTAVIFSNNIYLLFTLITLILFLLITARFINTYKNNNLKTTKYLAISFGILTLSKIIFVFTNFSPLIYAVGEIVQVIGFIVLLFSLTMVLKNAKKTR